MISLKNSLCPNQYNQVRKEGSRDMKYLLQDCLESLTAKWTGKSVLHLVDPGWRQMHAPPHHSAAHSLHHSIFKWNEWNVSPRLFLIFFFFLPKKSAIGNPNMASLWRMIETRRKTFLLKESQQKSNKKELEGSVKSLSGTGSYFLHIDKIREFFFLQLIDCKG